MASAALWLVFSSSTVVMRAEAGVEVRGHAFLYPSQKMFSCNSPLGSLLPEQRKETHCSSRDARPVVAGSSTQKRGVHFSVLC